MGQAMATMFWRLLGTDPGRKSLLCDHNGDRAEISVDDSFFSRYWGFIRRLLGEGGAGNPPPDPAWRYLNHDCYSSPEVHRCCIDIVVHEQIFESESTIRVTEDDGVRPGGGKSAAPAAEERTISNSTPATHHCIDIGVDDHISEAEIGNHEIRSAGDAVEGGNNEMGKLPVAVVVAEMTRSELQGTPPSKVEITRRGSRLRRWERRRSDQLAAEERPISNSTPTTHQCIDIGVDDHLSKTEIGNHQIYSTPAAWDAAVEGGNYEMKKLPVAARPSRRIRRGKLGPYNWEQKILLVGEGDFSFSASLAAAFGDAANMIATSLDSFDFLMQNYKRAVNNILELTSKNSKVIHGVDATKMANHPQLHPLKFDRIVYNFPHAGFSNLNAPQEDRIRKHQKLVRGFLGNAKKMIKDDGQIHITHKCVWSQLKWKIEMVGSSQGLRLVEESPFNLRHYPGYNTKYGYGGDKNFNWKPAKTYKFELAKKKPMVIVESESISEVVAKASGGGQVGGTLSAPEQPKKLGSYKYNADQRMLLIGEGDFSFAASLAVAFGDASNMVATSLDSRRFLKKNYRSAKSNILALTSRGCKVIHGVNATTMAIKHPQLRSLKFNCIVFNFPRLRLHPLLPRDAQLSKHQLLIKAFLANAKQMIRDDGQIHITHQCFGGYLEWNIKTLGSSEGLRLVEESPFNSKDYPGYCAKYGCGGDGSFDCNPAVTYKFQLPSDVPKKKTRRNRKTLGDVC